MIATENGSTAKLPPSVRDFEIYRYLKLECHSTRAAAREFGLSQTRVRQIAARVVEFFLESAPLTAGDEATDAQMVVAQQLAREQLEHLYARAIRTFNDTEREDVHGNLLPGKVSFLVAAARISMWMAKVPVHGAPAFREDGEGEAAEAAGPPIAPPVRPPNADCSLAPANRGVGLQKEMPTATASVSVAGTYQTPRPIKVEARQQFAAPAQMAGSAAVNPPSPDVAAPQAEDSPAAQRPLNRQERRARERLRLRLLKKKR
jgi:hypothetical protein